jgi:hypothetical protein
MPSSAYGFHRTQLNSVRVTFTNFMVFGGAIWTILNCLKRVYGGETGIENIFAVGGLFSVVYNLIISHGTIMARFLEG